MTLYQQYYQWDLLFTSQPLLYDYMFMEGSISGIFGTFCVALNVIGILLTIWMVLSSFNTEAISLNASTFYFKNIGICQLLWLTFNPLIVWDIYGYNGNIIISIMDFTFELALCFWLAIAAIKYKNTKLYGGFEERKTQKTGLIFIVYGSSALCSSAIMIVIYSTGGFFSSSLLCYCLLFFLFFSPMSCAIFISNRSILRANSYKEAGHNADKYTGANKPLNLSGIAKIFLLTWGYNIILFFICFFCYLFRIDGSFLGNVLENCVAAGVLLIHLQIIGVPIIYQFILNDYLRIFGNSVSNNNNTNTAKNQSIDLGLMKNGTVL